MGLLHYFPQDFSVYLHFYVYKKNYQVGYEDLKIRSQNNEFYHLL